jgi:hypothetical protein
VGGVVVLLAADGYCVPSSLLSQQFVEIPPTTTCWLSTSSTTSSRHRGIDRRQAIIFISNKSDLSNKPIIMKRRRRIIPYRDIQSSASQP